MKYFIVYTGIYEIRKHVGTRQYDQLDVNNDSITARFLLHYLSRKWVRVVER